MARKRLILDGSVSTEPRILANLVIDTSASMFASRAIEAVTAGLHQYRADILKESLLVRKLAQAVVTFSGSPQVLYPYGTVKDWSPPESLEWGSGTALGTALLEALRLQAEYIDVLSAEGVALHHALMFLITDGEPTGEPRDRVPEAARVIAETEKNLPFSFFPVGVEGANIDLLQTLTPKRVPLRLCEVADFAKFFRWLYNSLVPISRSQPGDRIQLPNPMNQPGNPFGWAVLGPPKPE